MGGDDDKDAPTTYVMVVSAHDRVVESRYKGGAHVGDLRYKSRPCKEWGEAMGKFCPRGARCDFAHGPIELRGWGPGKLAGAVKGWEAGTVTV